MSETAKHCYECMFILDARSAKRDFESLRNELSQILTKHGVEIAATHAWGERRFAYEIRRQKKGFYVLMHVKADPTALGGLRRDLGLYEPLLRQFFLRIDSIPEKFEFPAEPDERRDERGGDRRDDRREPRRERAERPEASARAEAAKEETSAGEAEGGAEAPAARAPAGEPQEPDAEPKPE